VSYPISPSQIAAKAARLAPSGMFRAPAPGLCAMCGTHYEHGESVSPAVLPETFTDYSALRNQGGDHICGWCTAVMNRDFSQTHLKSVICAEGVFSAASNDHIAYWLMNPPAGAWLFVQGDQKVQHIIFRTPVNHSQDVFQVRLGETVVTIRRAMLAQGKEAANALAAVANDIRFRDGKRGAALKSPFVSLSRDFDALSQGVLRRELLVEAQEKPEVKRLVNIIQKLTAGELWGLTAVLYATNPHRPEPKTSENVSQ
jgi:CRISPR type IV-associated protein Csf1